jgi:anti-sigma regulatory factor (Ser/Thr protein kinase)
MTPRTRELVRVRRRFPGRPEQVAAARGLVAAVLGPTSPLREVAALLVSEATTNAVLHTASGELGGSVEVACELADGRRLRVEVRDQGSDTQPHRKPHATDSVNGRGLELFDALATRWGARRWAEGHLVWFELEAAEPEGLSS